MDAIYLSLEKVTPRTPVVLFLGAFPLEEWYFSIVDVVGVLTEQPDARHASTYWAVLKKRLSNEGADQLLTNCKQLKLL